MKKRRRRKRSAAPALPADGAPNDLEVIQPREDAIARREDIGYSDYGVPPSEHPSTRGSGEGAPP